MGSDAWSQSTEDWCAGSGGPSQAPVDCPVTTETCRQPAKGSEMAPVDWIQSFVSKNWTSEGWTRFCDGIYAVLRPLGFGFGRLGFGFRRLDFGFRRLVFGFRRLGFGFRRLRSSLRTQCRCCGTQERAFRGLFP